MITKEQILAAAESNTRKKFVQGDSFLMEEYIEDLDNSFIDGATWALEQDNGNDPTDRMPEPGKLVLTTNGKGYSLCRYWGAGQHEMEIDDEAPEDCHCEEIDGKIFIEEGWYEEAEQQGSYHDSALFPREVARWWPLPTKS